MSKPVTMADQILRQLHRRKLAPAGRDLRNAIVAASRFILDREMSAFLADLSLAPFRCNPQRRLEIIDSLRRSSRLPHRVTWIEFDAVAFINRRVELGRKLFDFHGERPDYAMCPRMGFLLQEHQHLSTAIRVSSFAAVSNDDITTLGNQFQWAYSTTDDPLPWDADIDCGELACGIGDYRTPCVGVIYMKPIPDEDKTSVFGFTTHAMVVKETGILRSLFGFLSTLSDIPASTVKKRTEGGYVAGGQYHKYLEHSVVRLSLPYKTDRERLARKLIVAVRRRGHMVRGHWRVLAHCVKHLCRPGNHIWGVVDEQHGRCNICSVPRTWIDEHHRGDDSLGHVIHTYEVTHVS
jgi:hypothetical protein